MRELIKSERPDILLIQETKMSNVEVMALAHCFWKDCHGSAVSSIGAFGGMVTLFSSKYYCNTIKECQHWILSEFGIKNDPNVFYICNVYGPTHYKDKQPFWNSLSYLKDVVI